MAPPVAAWIIANQALLTGVGAIAGLEGVRKSSVAGSMQRSAQEAEAKKADQRSKQQMTTTLKLRQEQQKREGLAQEKPVIAKPFATESMKKKYTVRGDGSGANV